LATNKNKGDWGEKEAVKFLQKNAFSILETNWRYKNLEVDIIASLPDRIVFIEVKTRGSDEFGEPEVAVSLKKQRFLVAAANQYILEKNIDLEARFDIISILSQKNRIILKHLPDAFYPIVK